MLLTCYIPCGRAINTENGEANNVKNQLTGQFGGVPDTARHYKVRRRRVLTSGRCAKNVRDLQIRCIALVFARSFTVCSYTFVLLLRNVHVYCIIMVCILCGGRPMVCSGCRWARTTTAREARGNTRHLSRDTWALAPSSSRVSPESTVCSSKFRNCTP